MTWSFTTPLITQTGAETSLASLAGVGGITTKVDGAGGYIKTRYYVPDGVSIPYTTLSWDPRFESLHFGNTVCLFYPVNGSSSLTIGVQITQNGGTYTNYSEAITFGNNSGNAYQQTSGLRINTGALFWYSGIIRVQTCTGLGSTSFNNGGVATGTLTGYIGPDAVLEVMQVPAGQTNESCQIHIAGAVGFQVDGLNVRAYGNTPPSGLISMSTSTTYTNPPVFKMEGFGGITPQSDARQSTFATFYGLALKACKKGLNWYLGSLIRGVNCAAGSAVTLVEHNVDANHTQGYAEIRNEVDITCKDPAGTLLPNVRVYVKDTNNGDRKNYNIFSQSIDNTADMVYFGSTNGSGNLTWLGNSASILLCAVVRLTIGTVVGVDDSGLNKKDIRSLTNVKGTDDFRFHYWGYGTQYFSAIEIVQSNKVAYKIVQALLLDTNTSLSEAAAVTKLGSSFSVSGNTLTVTANSTLDDLYDAMKAYKTRAVQAQVEYPTITTQPVTANGLVLTTAMTIVVNTGITLSGGTKFTSIVAAAVTLTGNLSGLTVTAPVSQATPLSLTNVTIIGTLSYNTGSATSITYTNANVSTVLNLGVGIVTIARSGTVVIGNYADAEINFLDSSLTLLNASSAVIYSSAINRDGNISPGATISPSLAYKHGSTVSGVPMTGTVYFRVTSGSTIILSSLTLALGDNVLDMGTAGQLALTPAATAIEIWSKASAGFVTAGTFGADANVTKAMTSLIPDIR